MYANGRRGGGEKLPWKEREFPAEKGFGKADPRALASDSQSSFEEGEIRPRMEKMGLSISPFPCLSLSLSFSQIFGA